MTMREQEKRIRKLPVLRTERLLLRRLEPSDARDMYEYARLPEVTEYLLWSPHLSEEQTYQYLRQLRELYRGGTFCDWAVTLAESGKMIGTCGYTTYDTEHRRAEVGYVLNPRYWGQGIATEAVKAAVAFAFDELEMNRVEAHYIVGNDASRRVMEKCGMTFEGILRQYMCVKGHYRDIGVCAVTRDGFFAGNCYRRADGWLRRHF